MGISFGSAAVDPEDLDRRNDEYEGIRKWSNIIGCVTLLVTLLSHQAFCKANKIREKNLTVV